MSDLVAIAACYEAHFQCNGCMSGSATSNPNYPNSTQTTGIQTLWAAMMNNDGNCFSISAPASIAQSIMVRTFTDSVNGVRYCIAIDHRDRAPVDNRFDGGWFFGFIPDFKKDISRRIHFQGVHSGYDINTMNQNVRVGRAIGAWSVIVTGTHRYAVQQDGSTCQDSDGPTDPAHDDKTAMHKAWLQIWSSSIAQGKAPWHVQLHGMGTQCSDQIFISSGFSSSGANPTLYGPGTVTDQLRNGAIAAGFDADTPLQNSCTFVATTNIQGRIVYGVSQANACGTAASQTQVQNSKKFIHIEQRIEARDTTLNYWYDIFKNAIPTDCASGYTTSPTTKLCVPV
jgi:hypothetical protein